MCIYWIRDKCMIDNPDTFQEILLDKRNSDLYLNKSITSNNENVKVVSNVQLLGIHFDGKFFSI